MNKNKRGCWAEKLAIDLVAFDRKLKKVSLFEVKSENYRLTGPKKGTRISRGRRDRTLNHIINMLYVDKDGKIREGFVR